VKIELNKIPHATCEWFEVFHTLECGQVFRFFKLEPDVYLCISTDKWCVVEQKSDSVILRSQDLDYFRHYFDLDTDYNAIEQSLSRHEELATPISYCRGLHILRQDLLETIVSFMISANNNIGRIKNTLNDMSKAYGEAVEIVGETWTHTLYTLPSIDTLCEIDLSDWIKFGAGYRAPYLVETIRELKDTDVLERLRTLEYNEACETLKKLKGVGPKVADCVALFGLYHCDGFPVDTWIFKSLETPELNTKQKVYQHYTTRYGKYSGFAQQYIFYYNRSIKDKVV